MAKDFYQKLFSKSMQSTKLVIKAAWNDVRLNQFGQLFPAKPTVLNLLINDICNSHCQMCLIWQRKRDREITSNELAYILRDSLFNKVRSIGVSGGEPTLRSDLPEIFRVITEKRPRIHAVSIITNAILVDQTLSRILGAADICQQAGIRFNVMVSLDGVGEVHDQIRGRKGNFETAMQVIHYLKDKTEIPVLFGCTITKDNVWHVDELLDFAQLENIYGRFRIAEFIQRLYNDTQKKYIRNFTSEESFHLALFFTKLEHDFETNPTYQRTYRNIRSMLFEGSPRMIGCPYQTHAVVLDSRGQLLYCSPKSPVIGSALEIPAKQLYNTHIQTRKQIISQYCNYCIHDYHANSTLYELFQNLRTYYYHRRFHANRVNYHSKKVLFHPTLAYKSSLALVIGWYGTETAGDKAILGEIIHQLREKGTQQIILASFYPFISKKTIHELNEIDIRIIPTYTPELLHAAKVADETIMGGGPLMDLAALGPMLAAFIASKRNHKFTRIAGCGIGPLTQSQNINSVKELLRLADVIELRDQASVDWAILNTGRRDIIKVEDPAVGFVQRWIKSQKTLPEKGQTINCYFRSWPKQYSNNLTNAQFAIRCKTFEEQLGKWVVNLCQQNSLQPRLLSMHHFVMGGDDREFNRKFAHMHLARVNPIIEIHPFSVHDILKSMQEAAFCLTMRFHSTLFAHILGIPSFAIDYTEGGKVYNFLVDHNSLDHLVTVEQIIQGKWPDISLCI